MGIGWLVLPPSKLLLCLHLLPSLTLSLPPSLLVGFSCWQEGLWSLTGSAQALMLSLPIHSESSRPSSTCKWADTGARICTERWGQGHPVCPHDQRYAFSAWCKQSSAQKEWQWNEGVPKQSHPHHYSSRLIDVDLPGVKNDSCNTAEIY